MPRHPLMTPASVSPMAGSNPNSNVHAGFSTMPSRVMNSWTRIAAIFAPLPTTVPAELVDTGPSLHHYDVPRRRDSPVRSQQGVGNAGQRTCRDEPQGVRAPSQQHGQRGYRNHGGEQIVDGGPAQVDADS